MVILLIASVYQSFVNIASAFTTHFSDQGFYLNSQSENALLLGSILLFISYLSIETPRDDTFLLNMLSSFYSFTHFLHILTVFAALLLGLTTCQNYLC